MDKKGFLEYCKQNLPRGLSSNNLTDNIIRLSDLNEESYKARFHRALAFYELYLEDEDPDSPQLAIIHNYFGD